MDLSVNEVESYIHACPACRRTFRGPGAFQNHSRGCKPTKKRLRQTLAAAKNIIVARKRQRTNDNTITASGSAMDVSRDVSPVIHPAARVH